MRIHGIQSANHTAPPRAGLVAIATSIVLVLAAAAPPASAQGSGTGSGGETRVAGSGLSSTQIPASTPDPSGEFLASADAHDPDEGIRYDGIEHYELRQGNQPDDKARWRDTDYIHWTVFGATLLAKGEIHDLTPDRATIATSEAWGMEVVEACVEEGDAIEAKIRAENEIGFDYRYLVTGERIAEASVQLTGNAYDIHGNHHSLDLSDQRSETITTESSVARGLTLETAIDIGSSATLSPDGLALGATRALALKLVRDRRLQAKVVRRGASAGGGNDSTEHVVVKDELTGAPPLRATYVVSSDGAVTLRARAGRDDETDEDEPKTYPVYVQLQRFQVTNELRVWTSITIANPPPGDVDPVPPGADPGPGPTTPGDPGGTGDPTDPGGTQGGDETPDDPAQPDGDASTGGTPARRRLRGPAVPLPVSGELSGILEFAQPFGLDGERGSLPGMLAVGVDPAPDADLVFTAEVDPPDAVVFADGIGRITVPAGARWGSLPIHGARVGPATVSLHVLDDAGAPRATDLTLAVDLFSTAGRSEPELWAAVGERAWRPGAPVFVRAVVGAGSPALRAGRLGFAGLETTDTRVAIACDDPGGILEAPPGAVSIDAGKLWTTVPLTLRDRAGTAHLTLTAGTRTVTVTVQCVPQAWRSAESLRLPVGATGAVSFDFAERTAIGRPLEVTVASPGLALPAAAGSADGARVGEPAWFTELAGLAPGSTQVEIRAEGLVPLAIPLEVVPREVIVDWAGITVLSLPPAAEGSLLLLLPEGARFSGIGVPPELGDVLTIDAPRPRALLIGFAPSADLPQRLDLPCRIEWDPGLDPPRGVLVIDTVHAPPAGSTIHSYRVDIGG